jgi:catechol 2,3-dioxygenase-like lactoylglutathione lyase family enzyme
MAVLLNHTIVQAYDKKESAEFLARILGLGSPQSAGHFVTVEVANGVSLDFDNVDNNIRSVHYTKKVQPQHYAFQVSDEEFDAIFDRVCTEQLVFYADPLRQHAGEINTRHSGRGFYFDGPEGHNLEVFTRH